MPPTLLLHLPHSISKQANKSWRLFEVLDLVYHNTQGQQQIQYKPMGCVIMVGGNHFIVRWIAEDRNNGQMMEYDGIKGAEVSTTTDWWENLPRHRKEKAVGGMAIFYRQV
jgi:hypothetical protein